MSGKGSKQPFVADGAMVRSGPIAQIMTAMLTKNYGDSLLYPF